MLAMTLGGFVVRSKTTTALLPLATNRVFPSAVMASPSGADNGFTPLARAAQHWAPGNPPNNPLAPKPGIENVPVRQPNRVKLPRAESVGGMMGMQALALFPAWATLLAPPIVLTAKLLMVSTTTTSSPMRSDTKNRWLTGSTRLMSKELNGPPGSPVGLCSGTGMILMTA